MKSVTNFASFDALDIRVGKITKVEDSTSEPPPAKAGGFILRLKAGSGRPKGADSLTASILL